MKILKWAIIACLALIAFNFAGAMANPQVGGIHVEGAMALLPVLVLLGVIYAVLVGVRKLKQR